MQLLQDRSTFAVKIILASGALGLAGDLLLRSAPWGLNFPLWVALVLVCTVGLTRKAPVTLSRTAQWMALPIIAFSACFLWRDSDDLKIANGAAVFLAVGVLALRVHKGRLANAGVADYTYLLIGAWLSLTSDFATLVTRDLDWKGHPVLHTRLRSMVRGMLLATPILLVFGLLFASADEVFSKSLANAFSFDPAQLFGDLVIFSVIALFVGGLFRRMFLSNEAEPFGPPKPTAALLTIGTIEVATIFGLLDLLFLSFVFVQFRYFFGGAERVAHIAGLSYAQYARHGFFELASAAALTLPVILGAQMFLPKDDRKAAGTFSLFGSILIACVIVVLASGFQRMNLYVSTYGLTELRLFTTVFMIWLALALAWLALTVVRHRRERFSFGALMAAFVVILALNFANPDALIARTNMDPAKPIDVSYLASLSLDAVPTIFDRLDRLPKEKEAQLTAQLKTRWGDHAVSDDWRSLNLARVRYSDGYEQRLKK